MLANRQPIAQQRVSACAPRFAAVLGLAFKRQARHTARSAASPTRGTLYAMPLRIT